MVMQPFAGPSGPPTCREVPATRYMHADVDHVNFMSIFPVGDGGARRFERV